MNIIDHVLRDYKRTQAKTVVIKMQILLLVSLCSALLPTWYNLTYQKGMKSSIFQKLKLSKQNDSIMQTTIHHSLAHIKWQK